VRPEAFAMQLALLVLHLLIASALIGVVLLQRSEGSGLVSSGGNPMAGRGSANLLTRMTAWLATAFFFTSIVLTLLSQQSTRGRSILDELPAATQPAKKSGPAQPTPSDPAPGAPKALTPLPSLPPGPTGAPAPGASPAPAPADTKAAPPTPAPAPAPGVPPRSN
jgi:preprotein translocase subunit SecG